MRGRRRGIVGNIIIAACLICLISIAATFFAGGRDLTRTSVFGYKLTFVVSESMEPTITTHALCLMKVYSTDDEAEENVKTGDVIVYEYTYEDGTTINIIHRVISITDSGYITKGDNNSLPDEDPVSPDQVVGVVVKYWNGFANIFD